MSFITDKVTENLQPLKGAKILRLITIFEVDCAIVLVAIWSPALLEVLIFSWFFSCLQAMNKVVIVPVQAVENTTLYLCKQRHLQDRYTNSRYNTKQRLDNGSGESKNVLDEGFVYKRIA